MLIAHYRLMAVYNVFLCIMTKTQLKNVIRNPFKQNHLSACERCCTEEQE